uniref:Protein KRI1 homolog n=1 Tax=Homalodisca liturata TaxID=320908 RepID=A0A1B6IVV0_9HEMI
MKPQGKDELLELSSEESQSEDDEDGWMLTEEVEKNFYDTLSKIKNRDPKIYEKDVEFFKDIQKPEYVKKNSKAKPLTLQDYERKMIIEKGAEWSEEDSETDDKNIDHLEPTYVQEQEDLKKSFKAVINSSSEDDEESDWAGFLKKREKAAAEKATEEEDFKEWLKEQESRPETEIETEPLQDYWSNPELNKDDQFLRDYILNKKFLDKNEEDNIPAKDAVDFEAEDNCNHRFEEPDQEFIKRYPRTMENSLRRKNDSRKKKREEVKERKLKDKQKKRAEINRKKNMMRKEIEEKIEELKKLTGNDQVENIMNDEDFDIDDYDKAMQKLFNDEFYCQDDPDFKPSGASDFQDNWGDEGGNEDAGETEEYNNTDHHEEYQYNGSLEGYGETADDNESLNCEDPNFNMDCDYDPTLNKPKKDSRSRRRKDKHRRTFLSEAVSKEKPIFNPTTHKSFQEYVDQYYAIDCEDFIGDLPCRFKYRRTVPNSYGLTIEEILTADEKELERWCSIKRIGLRRPEFKEKGDLKVFQKKAADERLKRKILPSLYKKQEEEEEDAVHEEQNDNCKNNEAKTLSDECAIKENSKELENMNENKTNLTLEATNLMKKTTKGKKKKKKRKAKESTDTTKKDNSHVPSKKRKLESSDIVQKRKKIKVKEQNNGFVKSTSKFRNNKAPHKINQNYQKNENVTLTGMSDARLLAYGIKPKKFRNKLKYSKES